MKDPLTFIQQYAPILRFGFLLTLFSSFGQTFFTALLNTDIRQQLGLSHGGFGTVYSLATLLSGGGHHTGHPGCKKYTIPFACEVLLGP